MHVGRCLIRARRLIQLVLIRTGWISLFLGLGIPFSVSLYAIYQLRDPRCTTELAWTAAPLLYTCGPRTPEELFIGWTGTVVSIALLVLAAVVGATVMVNGASLPPRSGPRRAGFFLATTTLVVLLAMAAVLAGDPDGRWSAVNAWVFFVSGTGLLVSVIALVLRAALNRWIRGAVHSPES